MLQQAMKISKAKVTGYGLIIDKNGMPLIKEPLTVPDEVWNGLTDEQRNFANNRVENNLKRI